MVRPGKEMVNVRIPQVLFEEIERVINQVPIAEADGTIKRVSEPYGLTNSNTALVNTVLLALLSSIVPTSRVTLLTQVTPGVNMTYINEAKKRLVPDQSLNIPVSEVVDLSTRQREGFDKLASAMEKMYVTQQQYDQQLVKNQGSLVQLLSYWVGANSQANVSDPSTYNDQAALLVKNAIEVFGEQHLADMQMKQRQEALEDSEQE